MTEASNVDGRNPISNNRHDRRFWSSGAPKLLFSGSNSLVVITPPGAVIENENDESLIRGELRRYQELQGNRRIKLLLYNKLIKLGASEEACADYFLDETVLGIEKDRVIIWKRLWSEIEARRFTGEESLINKLAAISTQVSSHIKDEDESVLLKIGYEQKIPLGETLRETIRSRDESIALFQLQLDWLKQIKRQQKQQRLQEQQEKDDQNKKNKLKKRVLQNPVLDTAITDAEVETVNTLPKEVMVVEPEISFELQGWTAYWTEKFWSSNEGHLTAIPTNSRQEALLALNEVARKQVPIKLTSVLRALEFPLFSRDVIQRALATRYRFAPEQTREWIKVKRGSARIGIFIPPETDKTVIFFAGHRSLVYR